MNLTNYLSLEQSEMDDDRKPIWNERQLKGPAIVTKSQKLKKLDLSALRKLLQKNLKIFSEDQFNENAAHISRLIARRAHSFRLQYGFRLMRKVNIALCRTKDCGIKSTIETFLGTLPDFVIEGAKKAELPTKDHLNYVLIRLQSIAKILLRIVELCKDAVHLFLNEISKTFFLEINTIYIGVFSQVWQQAKDLCTKSVDFYNQLYVYGKHFLSSSNWLESDNLHLPENLETFLGESYSSECLASNLDKTSTNLIPENSLSIDLNFGNDLDIVVDEEQEQKSVKEKNNHKKKVEAQHEFKKIQAPSIVIPVAKIESIPSSSEDFGVAISRDSMKQVITLDMIKVAGDVGKFMSTEKDLRNSKKHQNSKHLNDLQWKEFQIKVNHILITSQGRMTVKKFKKLWYDKMKK